MIDCASAIREGLDGQHLRGPAVSVDRPRDCAHPPCAPASKHYRQNSQGLLFANRRGRPFSANKLREKKLRPLLGSLGIPLAGFHTFCHGVATTLIDQGASITTVGAQLRHSDPRITLGLYAHVVPQSQRDTVEGLASVLGSGQLLTQRLNADSAPRKSFVS